MACGMVGSLGWRHGVAQQARAYLEGLLEGTRRGGAEALVHAEGVLLLSDANYWRYWCQSSEWLKADVMRKLCD